jgi:hypothetical protein
MLADDGSQTHGELSTDVVLRFLREDVHEAGQRALGVAGVQSGENQVAGFGGAQRHLRGFAVADFAYQNHIRILAQAMLEAVREGIHVAAHLTLGDDSAQAGSVDVLDGFLDRQYATTAILADQINEGRERGSLAGTGYARDDHQPVAVRNQPLGQLLRKAQPLQRRNRVRNVPQAGTPLALRQVHAGAEAAAGPPVCHRHRAVEVLRLVEQATGALGNQRLDNLSRSRGVEAVVASGLHSSVHAERRGVARDEMNVRRTALDR